MSTFNEITNALIRKGKSLDDDVPRSEEKEEAPEKQEGVGEAKKAMIVMLLNRKKNGA